MKRNYWAILALLVAGLICPVISIFGAAPGEMQRVGIIDGQNIYGVNTSGYMRAKITGGISGQTQFKASGLAGAGADGYNAGWKIRVSEPAGSETAGTIVDITDYANDGTFTVVAVGATWTVGTWVELMTDGMAFSLYGYVPGSLTGVVTTASGSNSVVDPTDADTITVANFAGLSSTLFSGLATGVTASRFYLRFEAADEAADAELVGQYRSILSLSSAGVVIYQPGFDVGGSTDVIDAGDIVSIVPFSEINPNPQSLYRGTVLSGSGTTAVFPDLIGLENMILKDAYIKMIHDEAGSDEGDMALVSAFTAATGTVTFTTGILTPTVNDFVEISWTPAAEMQGGANGWPAAVTGAFPGVNVSGNEAQQWMADSLRRAFVQLTTVVDSLEDANDLLQALYLSPSATRVSTTSSLAGTASATDSLTAFTVGGSSGGVWVTSLQQKLTVTPGAADVTDFVIQVGAAGGTIVRVGLGKDWNGIVASAVQYVNPTTLLVGVYTDSLAYTPGLPIIEQSTTGWRMFLPASSVVKMLSTGTGTSLRVQCKMEWYPADNTAITVTAG